MPEILNTIKEIYREGSFVHAKRNFLGTVAMDLSAISAAIEASEGNGKETIALGLVAGLLLIVINSDIVIEGRRIVREKRIKRLQ